MFYYFGLISVCCPNVLVPERLSISFSLRSSPTAWRLVSISRTRRAIRTTST